MLAKIVAHGRDHSEAFDRLTSALDQTVVLGLTTNLRFLRWLVRDPAVLDGQARIDTLDRIWPPDDWAERTAVPDEAWAEVARILSAASGAAAGIDPFAGGWRLNAAPTLRIESEGEERSVVVPRGSARGDETNVVLDADGTVHVDLAGRSTAFRLAPPPDVDRAARAAAAHGQAGGGSTVVAPMPGGVLALHVAAGDTVDVGDPIATLEAMKMEHVVTAPTAGRVVEVFVRTADQVTRAQQLVTIEP